MPSMADPYFSKTITYICTHNEDGAMGIVINRPIELNVANLFTQMKLEINFSTAASHILNEPLYFGGPVQQERGFILHKPTQEFNSTVVINDNVALTTSRDILEATANNQGPEKMLIALGYAGWTSGQIENEIARNAWLNLDTEDAFQLNRLIFDAPNEDKFSIALALMGLNLTNLSDMAGHA